MAVQLLLLAGISSCSFSSFGLPLFGNCSSFDNRCNYYFTIICFALKKCYCGRKQEHCKFDFIGTRLLAHVFEKITVNHSGAVLLILLLLLLYFFFSA